MKKYIWLLSVAGIIVLFISSMYKHVEEKKNAGKAQRLSCHKEVITFERVYKKDAIKTAQKALYNGNYSFTSSIRKSVYEKSKLFNYINLKQTDALVDKELQSYNKNSNSDMSSRVDISYYIYENDIKDPGKKTPKSKLYAGYVVFEFFTPKKESIYKVQVDFMDKKGADISKSISCSFKSFMTL